MEKKDKVLPKYCIECGKEIQDREGYETIETKRKRVIYVHRKCLRRKGHESKSVDTGSERGKGL